MLAVFTSGWLHMWGFKVCVCGVSVCVFWCHPVPKEPMRANRAGRDAAETRQRPKHNTAWARWTTDRRGRAAHIITAATQYLCNESRQTTAWPTGERRGEETLQQEECVCEWILNLRPRGMHTLSERRQHWSMLSCLSADSVNLSSEMTPDGNTPSHWRRRLCFSFRLLSPL